MEANARRRAVLRAAGQRFAAAAKAPGRAAQQDQRWCQHDDREQGESGREEGCERKLDRQENSGDRDFQQVSEAQDGAGNVVEEQRLHPRLPDPAGLVPARLGQGCSRAQLERCAIARLEPAAQRIAPHQQHGPKRHREQEQGRRHGQCLVGVQPFERSGNPLRQPRNLAQRNRGERDDHQQAEPFGDRSADHQRQQQPQARSREAREIPPQHGERARNRRRVVRIWHDLPWPWRAAP
jgi:hypothetical protein